MGTETIFLKKAAEDNYTDFLEDYFEELRGVEDEVECAKVILDVVKEKRESGLSADGY